MLRLDDVLQQNQLSICFSPGDGHCLLYSFVSSWRSQFPRQPELSLKTVIDRSILEFSTNFELYKPFFIESFRAINHQLQEYLFRKDYNQSIGDIYPAVLANTFGVDLCIVDQKNANLEECSIIHVESIRKTHPKSLFLHRINGNHYNGFTINPDDGWHPAAEDRKDTTQCHAEKAATEDRTAPCLRYSGELLRALNHADKVTRATRKQLFSHNIWKPRIKGSNISVISSQPKESSSNRGRESHNLINIKVTKDGNNQRPATKHLNICTVNTQSIRNKSGEFVEHVISNKIDLCAVTETWLQSGDDAVRQECQPVGYSFMDCPRQCGRKGGGTALLCRSSLAPSLIRSGENKAYEFSEWLIKKSAKQLRVVIVYRPPYSTAHPVSAKTFMDDFAEYLQEIILCKESLIITGDFNFHMDDGMDGDAAKFKELLLEFGLTQHVKTSTHEDGHTLDLIITRGSDSVILSEPTGDHYISDHAFVACKLDIPIPTGASKTITYRKFCQVDTVEFRKDIEESCLAKVNDTSCEDAVALEALASQYNATLQEIADKHAPELTKTIKLKPALPWFSDDLKALKQQRRKAERKWLQHRGHPIKSVTYKDEYKLARNEYRSAINKAKTDYFSDKVLQCQGDQKKLFALIKSLSKPMQQEQYPDSASLHDLANAFGEFFAVKIKNIRTKLEKHELEAASITHDNIKEEEKLHAFTALSEDDIRKLIRKSPNKQCDSDPIPTWLLKECLDPLLPILTLLVNKSLELGYFPEAWKNALVTPLLKKLGLELVFPNFRPVSNLPFVSKLAEKASVDQLKNHMDGREALPPHQSAYRPYHSTETALLKVQSDILMNMDSQRVTLLVMLDLSAAFDTIDHNIMVETLKSGVGVDGIALQWFISYLSKRTQQVKVSGVTSEKIDLDTGVPQGSCLGPVLFTVYVADLFQIIQKHLPEAHGYADDHQVYLSFRPLPLTNQQAAVKAMENCICELRRWMISNWLMVNDSKTEFMIVGSRQQLERVTIPNIQVGEDRITPATSVRNLGVIFDPNLKMDMHVNKACRGAYYHLHNIRRIRKYLTDEATCTIIHAFVTSQIDYCNSLMSELPATLIKKVQRVQNTAARLVYRLGKYDHITPALITLHWLPVKYRIEFKILLLVFKGLHNMAPSYIKEMLVPAITNERYPKRLKQRLNNSCLLKVPKVKTTSGKRAFAVNGPTKWNELPSDLRLCDEIEVFKRKLKTHIFTRFVNESM